VPFKLNQELDEGRAPSINNQAFSKRALALKINQKEAKNRARSAEAGRRRPRAFHISGGDVERSKVTTGVLGYSYRKVQNNRIQSTKSLSSFNS